MAPKDPPQTVPKPGPGESPLLVGTGSDGKKYLDDQNITSLGTNFRLDNTHYLGSQLGAAVAPTTDPAAVGDPLHYTYQPAVPGTEINGILDSGDDGMKWFDLALTRWHRYHGDYPQGVDGPLKLWAAYHEQRDMKLGALTDASNALGQALDTACKAVGEQGTANSVVADSWKGYAGSAAHHLLQNLSRQATTDLGTIISVRATIDAAVTALRTCVQAKADAIKPFADIEGIDGKSMRNGDRDDVSVLISAAFGDFGTWNQGHTIDRVADMLPYALHTDHMIDIQWDADPAAKRAATAAAKRWLDEIFTPAVQDTVNNFLGMCRNTDSSVHNIYATVNKAMGTVVPLAYPQPHAPQPNPIAPGPVGPAGPSGPHAPSGPAGPGNTNAAGAQPPSPTPGSPNNAPNNVPNSAPDVATMLNGLSAPLQTVSAAASQLSQLAQQGLGQVQSAVSQNVEQLTQQARGLMPGGTPPGSGNPQAPNNPLHNVAADMAPGSMTLAEFPVPGGHVTISRGPNGDVTVRTAGDDGKPRSFTMGIKDGVPFLAPDSNTPTAAAPGAVTNARPIAAGGVGVGGDVGPSGLPLAPAFGLGPSQPPVSAGATPGGPQPGVSTEPVIPYPTGQPGTTGAIPSFMSPQTASGAGDAQHASAKYPFAPQNSAPKTAPETLPQPRSVVSPESESATSNPAAPNDSGATVTRSGPL